jgi:uncharacterized pyridoxamine 5'-phosphate oxidase family protein
MKTLDTPLTRLKAKYDAIIAEKDVEIAEMKIQASTVRGVNDMLKFELVNVEKRLVEMQKTLDEAFDHFRTLKLTLPDIER